MQCSLFRTLGAGGYGDKDQAPVQRRSISGYSAFSHSFAGMTQSRSSLPSSKPVSFDHAVLSLFNAALLEKNLGVMKTPPTRRRRPALSCMECRRRKVKCDRANPCNHCTAQRTICSYKQDLRASSATAPRPVSNVQTPVLSGSGASASSDQHYLAPQHPPGHQVLSPSSRSGSLCVSQSALRAAISNSTLLDSRYNADPDSLLSVELSAASKVKMKKTRVAGWSDRAGSDLVGAEASAGGKR
jgi:hypothetical protein